MLLLCLIHAEKLMTGATLILTSLGLSWYIRLSTMLHVVNHTLVDSIFNKDYPHSKLRR